MGPADRGVAREMVSQRLLEPPRVLLLSLHLNNHAEPSLCYPFHEPWICQVIVRQFDCASIPL